MSDFSVITYNESYWLPLLEFFKRTYKQNHPLTKKDVFDWYYHGFGDFAENKLSKLLLYKDEIIGFRGVIPVVFRIPTLPDAEIVNGGSFAMWMIDEDYRKHGLGYEMLKAIEKENRVIYTAGSNKNTSVPIYLRNNYTEIESFNRYVIPLNDNYFKLTLLDEIVPELKVWTDEIVTQKKTEDIVEPIAFTPEALEDCFMKIAQELNWFTLNKNADYWRWRYAESLSFKYLQFGNPSQEGALIARIENIISDDHSKKDLKLLRVIELIPGNVEYFNADSTPFSMLVQKVLNWAVSNQCVAADFQCSTDAFSNILSGLNFKKQVYTDTEEGKNDLKITSLANLFQPLDFGKSSINAYYKVYGSDGELIEVLPENTYFVKTDSDTDRNNI